MNMGFSVQEFAKKLGGELFLSYEVDICGANGLEKAETNDISFIHNPRYLHAVEQTKAGLIIASKDFTPLNGKNFLLVENPTLSFQQALEHFTPIPQINWLENGTIDPSSYIHPTAQVHPSASIGPNCTIAPDVIIGPNCQIIANCTLYPGCTLGENVTLHASVVIREECIIGDRVIIQPGCVIGSCGYGYAQEKGQHVKLKQLGNVIIENDVEIGANTTIDRGHFSPTIIGQGTKIDNLVQIAHGVKLGKANLIIGQTGVSGSTKTGDYVILAGQVGVAGHLELTSGVTVAAQSGVTKSIKSPGQYGGSPATDLKQWHVQNANIKQIPKLKERIQKLEKLLKERLQQEK